MVGGDEGSGHSTLRGGMRLVALLREAGGGEDLISVEWVGWADDVL